MHSLKRKQVEASGGKFIVVYCAGSMVQDFTGAVTFVVRLTMHWATRAQHLALQARCHPESVSLQADKKVPCTFIA